MDQVQISFALVDVFASRPLSGNGLSIFLLKDAISSGAMLSITQEMRQFESIFLTQVSPFRFDARIFTMEEELPFAGHPIIGAAAYLHQKNCPEQNEVHFHFITLHAEIAVRSRCIDGVYWAEMDQGQAIIAKPLPTSSMDELLAALNLTRGDLVPDLPLQVISTGLPYLIVPLQHNLQQAKIIVQNLESLLAEVGARFVYILDIARREGRTWDNIGRVEDIATGSAAGPAAVYLTIHGFAKANDVIMLTQGQYTGRPSEIFAQLSDISHLGVHVRGQVCFVGEGILSLPKDILHA